MRASDFGQRFALNARRLLSMDLDEPDSWLRYDQSRLVLDLRVLLAWSAQTDLFPRLRSLSVIDRFINKSEQHAMAFREFLRLISVTQLCIYVSEEPVTMIAAKDMSSLLGACMRMEELIVMVDEYYESYGEGGTHMWADFVGDMLASGARLRVCKLDIPINLAGIISLAHLPNLAELDVRATLVDYPETPSFLPEGAFPRLCVLKVSEDTPSARFTQGILHFRSCSRLRDISLSFHDCTVNSEDTCVVLHRLGNHRSLEHISIHIFHGVADPIRDTLLSALSPMPHLKRLYFSSFKPFKMDRVLLDTLLRLCPALCQWECRYFKGWGQDGISGIPISIADLLRLLNCYPNITKLPVYINTLDLPSSEAQASFPLHAFGPDLDVQEDACTSELRQVIRKVLPYVLRLGVVASHASRSLVNINEL
jgi:hypothetical protein